MLTPKPPDASLRRLMRLYRTLGESERDALLVLAERYGSLGPQARRSLDDFAAFLAERPQTERADGVPAEGIREPQGLPPEPERLPRPRSETVIAAIRRLTRSYAMLDRGPLLNETSALMSAHVLQGRAAAEVIDDLEALFERHYRDSCGDSARVRDTRTDGSAGTGE